MTRLLLFGDGSIAIYDGANKMNDTSMRVLFVTSFNSSMYERTGCALIGSFLKFAPFENMLVCYEDVSDLRQFEYPKILTYNLQKSMILHRWLQENADVIPIHLGGKATQCDCPARKNSLESHKPGCAWSWFNRNASRWFRKIVAIHHAASFPGYSAIVWVDCDCAFRSNLPPAEIEAWFRENSVFYLKSRDREVIESGVIGFRTTKEGRTIIDSVMKRYLSRRFRSDARWDDAYQLQLSIEAHPEVSSIDLATHATGTPPYGHVVPNSPIGKYISHRKGVHGAWGMRLMT